jgi:hypothetical protein
VIVRLALVALLGGLSAACSIASPPVSQSNSPSASAVASASGSPTSSPAGEHLTGRLPVEFFDPNQSVPAQGGFVDLSTGVFVRDPKAGIVSAGDWQLMRTTDSPHLYGVTSALYATTTYDAQVGRWLPVAKQQVASDGLSYAYAEWYSSSTTCPTNQCMPQPVGGRIHVSDARSGQDKVVYSFGSSPMYQVVSYTGPQVYLETTCPNGGHCDELWRFDIKSGALSKVVDAQGSWWILGGQTLWMVTLGNGDIAPTYLRKIDLATGTSETWLTAPSISDSNPYIPDLRLIGVDPTGMPLVALGSRSPAPLLRVTAPNKTEEIFSADGPYSESVSDGNRAWFAIVDNGSPTPTMLGLYVYTAQSGVQKISPLHLLPV